MRRYGGAHPPKERLNAWASFVKATARSSDSYGKRRDGNEGELVAALVRVGAFVYRCHEPCDLIVRFRERTHLLDCEVLNSKRTREPSQLAVFEALGVIIVHTIDEALAAVGLAFGEV